MFSIEVYVLVFILLSHPNIPTSRYQFNVSYLIQSGINELKSSLKGKIDFLHGQKMKYLSLFIKYMLLFICIHTKKHSNNIADIVLQEMKRIRRPVEQ
jgi:hypothetical protein